MQIDFLIIGQGISGTFLSWWLGKNEKTFLVIDRNDSSSPSRIAAGIINPVTGRRLVTVWMADEIIPFANNSYKEIGLDLGITAITQKNIIDFFPSPDMRLSFLQRIVESGEYVHAYPDQNHFNHLFNFDFGCGEIKPAYTAQLETLLPAWRKKLEAEGNLLEEDFQIEQLQVFGTEIRYKDIKAGMIIFCDGNNSSTNPYFRQLPFAPNKGEALLLEIPGLPDHTIFKRGMMLSPMSGQDIFWLGSDYQWEFDHPQPTSFFLDRANNFMKEWLKLPFHMIDHFAGIRPATLERRPFVGLHPHYPLIGILNGMGTKGCSLAPFFAKQLVSHILDGHPILPEANVNRFSRLLTRN